MVVGSSLLERGDGIREIVSARF
jgi:hypothetical protein